MGNRIYIHSVNHPPTHGGNSLALAEVAEYANGLPGLWRVLLSVGATPAPVTDPDPYLFVPRVPTLYVERAPAERRLRDVLGLLAKHPRFGADTGFLQRKQALLDVFLPSLPGDWFAFSLDEMAWFEEEDEENPDVTALLSRWMSDIDALGHECERALHQRDAKALASQLVYGPARVWSSVLGMEHWSHPYFQYAQAGECWTEFAARDRGTWHQPVVPADVGHDGEHHDSETRDEESPDTVQGRLIGQVIWWVVKAVVISGLVLVGGLLHLVLRWVFGGSPWWQWPLWGIALFLVGMVVVAKDSERARDGDGRS